MPWGSNRARRPAPDPDQPISVYWARELVLQRDQGRCVYCGCAAPDGVLEHKVPRRRGGPTTLNNCVLACPSCNSRKNDRTVEEYLAGTVHYQRISARLPVAVVQRLKAIGGGSAKAGILRLLETTAL